MRIRENIVNPDFSEYWGDITFMLKEFIGDVVDKAEVLLACKFDYNKYSDVL